MVDGCAGILLMRLLMMLLMMFSVAHLMAMVPV